MTTYESFISDIKDAVVGGSGLSREIIVERVKRALQAACRSGLDLPTHLCATSGDAECYARHLAYGDPEDRFQVIVMVWDAGQGTPLHDHADLWCVECVYKGEIRVTRYEVTEPVGEDTYFFSKGAPLVAREGEAGHLIPPVDHHTIENMSDTTPAITIHVYGGVMTESSIFLPQEDGSYLRKIKKLPLLVAEPML